MALPLRNNLSAETESSSVLTSSTTVPWVEADASHVFEPGGQVGRMYADLVVRLSGSPAGMEVAPPLRERFVRLVSIAGGYLTLAASYAIVVRLMLR